jgi:hypothetical protein
MWAAFHALIDVVESGTLAARLALGQVTVSGDGVSCDQDGILDPGESGQLHISLANLGIVDPRTSRSTRPARARASGSARRLPPAVAAALPAARSGHRCVLHWSRAAHQLRQQGRSSA